MYRGGGGRDVGGSGAAHLVNIYGTEQDKYVLNLTMIFDLLTVHNRVNCSFYFKIGACRHGDRCSRLHIKPLFSQTVLIPNCYMEPPMVLRRAVLGFWRCLVCFLSFCCRVCLIWPRLLCVIGGVV